MGVFPTQSSNVFLLFYFSFAFAQSLVNKYPLTSPIPKDMMIFLFSLNVDSILLNILIINKEFIIKFRYISMANPKDKVKNYLEEMNNYDPDLQQMGAKYLCDLILSGEVNLLEDPQLARTITENFLKQVGSQSFVVHSAAIRFLAEMVPKLPNDQLVHIFHETISAIAKIDTPAERRQIFSTAAGTMIHLAPDELGITLSNLFVQSIQQLMKSKGENVDIEMLLLNVITEFTRKWPNVAKNKDVKFDREALIEYLLVNIETSKKLLLIRKTDGALSKLSVIFDKNNLQYLFCTKNIGLLGFIRKHISTNDQQEMKSLRNGILSLSNILKGQNHEVKHWAKQIVTICTKIINFYKDKDTYLDLSTQIIENAIASLTYLLKAYSFQLNDIFKHTVNEMNDFVEECLNFDLEGMMTFLENEEPMQDQYEDEEDYYSEDSVCWKVRAATIRYTTVLMHKDRLFRDNKVKSKQFLNLLSTKLIQENQKVSTSAFQCFNYIIESISTNKKATQDIEDMGLRRVKSAEGDFAMDIVQQVSDQIGILFSHKKTKEVTKTEASKILLRIIQLLRDRIIQNQQVCLKLLNQVTNEVEKVKTDSCVNLLKVIKSLVQGIPDFKMVQNILSKFLKFTSNPNLKIVSISYGGIRSIMNNFYSQLLKSSYFKKVFNNILEKLKEHDADRIVKASVIKCLRPIFEQMFINLSDDDKTIILKSVYEKLKIEIQKSLILSQISKIPDEYVLKNAHSAILNQLLQLSSQSLGTANFQLNANAIECCEKLINIQKSKLNEKLVQNVLHRCRSLLFEGKIPNFIQILLKAFPKAFKDYVELIVRTAESFYIKQLISHKITDPKTCIEILKGIAKLENAKKISLILSEIGIDEKSLMKDVGEDQWGVISIGSIGYVGNQKSVQYLLKLISDGKSEEVKYEASRSLGNIASRNHKLAFEIMNIADKNEDPYPYIFAVKQMLNFTQKSFPGIEDIIKWLFEKAEKNDRESNHYVISQSIGIIAKSSPKEALKIIRSRNQMNSIRKFIVASSLRYMLQGSTDESIHDESIEQYCSGVVELTKDKEVNVRYGAMKSLNSISHSHYSIIKGCINDSFITSLKDNLTINPDLIIIVDYGVNKEKKDLGKPLRTQAFNFLKVILDHRKIQVIYEDLIKKCLFKILQQSTNDLILKRVSIIAKICEKDFTAFIPIQHQFSTCIGVEEGVLKSQAKKASDDERNEAYLKNLLKEIIEIRNISERENSDNIKAMVNSIKSIPRFNKIIECFDNE